MNHQSSVPLELTALRQWVCWKLEDAKSGSGKKTKIPYCVETGSLASSTDPATWTTYGRAVDASRGYDGVGFVFSVDDPYCGIDLDNSIEMAGDLYRILSWANPYYLELASYSEISPSGHGLKIWVKAKFPGATGRKRNKAGPNGGAVEIYDHFRYFTVTGERFGAYTTIENRQGVVDAMYAALFPAKVASQAVGDVLPGGGLNLPDGELVRRIQAARGGDAFRRLWGGSTAEHGEDHSAADMAMCNTLAFWVGPDPSRIDRLFRQSGLFRDKWEREDYRTRTIGRVLEGRTDYYRPAEGGDDASEPYVAFMHAECSIVLSSGVVSSTVEVAEPLKVVASNGNGNHVASADAVGRDLIRLSIPDAVQPPPFDPGKAGGGDAPKGERFKVFNAIDHTYTAMVDGKEKKCHGKWYVDMPTICATIQKRMNQWPRRAGGLIFHLNDNLPDIPDSNSVGFISKSDDLFGWIGKTADVRWVQGEVIHEKTKEKLTPPTKGEMLSYLTTNLEPSYNGIEFLPHHPPFKNTYYLPTRMPKVRIEDSGPLDTLVNAFNPETLEDRMLLLAALLTPGWGGETGARPVFVLSSDFGKGSGKTSTAIAIASVWGGSITVDAKDDWEKFKSSMLCDDALSKRICFMDNIKGRLNSPEIESAITMDKINGWRPYHGYASRPNNMTWIFTSNTPNLSSDLSLRAVNIKIGAQRHTENFVSWAPGFIAEHRAEIIAKSIEYLRRDPVCKIKRRDRFKAWQDGILSRLEMGNELAELIINRRAAMDGDSDDADSIASAVLSMMRDKFPGRHERINVMISRQQLHECLLKAGVIDKSMGNRGTTTYVRDKLGQGNLTFLVDKRMNDGRWWMYQGPDAPQGSQIDHSEYEVFS